MPALSVAAAQPAASESAKDSGKAASERAPGIVSATIQAHASADNDKKILILQPMSPPAPGAGYLTGLGSPKPPSTENSSLWPGPTRTSSASLTRATSPSRTCTAPLPEGAS